MSATDVAAWVGAVGAVVALAWDFFKWHFAGAKLQLHLAPHMEMLAPTPLSAHGKLIVVTLVNVGDAPTTLTHVVADVYPNWWAALRQKRKESLIFMPIWLGPPMPHILPPGEQWACALSHARLVEVASAKDIIRVGVHHAVSRRPVGSTLRLVRKAVSNNVLIPTAEDKLRPSEPPEP